MRLDHKNRAPSLKKPLRIAATTLALTGSGVGASAAEAATSHNHGSQSIAALVEKGPKAAHHETAKKLDEQWTNLVQRAQTFAHSPASSKPNIKLSTYSTNFEDGTQATVLSIDSSLYDSNANILREYVVSVVTPNNTEPNTGIAPDSMLSVSVYEVPAPKGGPSRTTPSVMPGPKTIYNFNFEKNTDGVWQINASYGNPNAPQDDPMPSIDYAEPQINGTESIKQHSTYVHELITQANNVLSVVESGRVAVGSDFPTHLHPHSR